VWLLPEAFFIDEINVICDGNELERKKTRLNDDKLKEEKDRQVCDPS
jgi:hypothetical protein